MTVSASGGTSPYTGTGDFVKSAGTYTFVVTDSLGTTATATVTITQPEEIRASINYNPISVNGGTTTVVVTASGGVGPYEYKIDSGSYSSTSSFTSVTAGSHTITVKDANNATKAFVINITQPTSFYMVELYHRDVYRGYPGSVTVRAYNGKIPIVYKIGNGAYSTKRTFSNLAVGSYVITAKDANDQTVSITINIKNKV